MEKTLRRGFLLSAVVCAGHVSAQPYTLLSEGNTPWRSVMQLRADSAAAPQDPMLRQLLAQAESIAGNERVACALRPSRPPAAGDWVDARALLTAAVQARQLVMFNESHDRSRHRAWVLEMLPPLHAAGFRALAAETFAADIQAATADGLVRSSGGIYLRDPVFAALVQEAVRLGWELVPYEVAADSEAAATRQGREHGQAQALANWLERHPDRPLVVLAGGEHISEDPHAGWMAARLSQLTGLDPLTVAQGATACAGEDASLWPVPPADGVTSVMDRGRVSDGRVDLVVHHLPVPDQDGRAGWLAGLGGRNAVRVCLPPSSQPRLLRAFAVDDADNQLVASDQTEVQAGALQAVLMLPSGRWWVALEDARGQLHHLGSLVTTGDVPASGCRAVELPAE